MVAIGTHDLDTIKGPFVFDAEDPRTLKFVPLNQDKEFSASELMEFYSVGDDDNDDYGDDDDAMFLCIDDVVMLCWLFCFGFEFDHAIDICMIHDLQNIFFLK